MRKSHRKSRSGCVQCKARRIKCGEQIPRCTNCEKHAIHCEYPDNPPSTGSYVVRSAEKGLNMEHLGLLHYFVATVSEDLGLSPPFIGLWKNEAVELAKEHEFLMRGLMSVSALHLARANTNQRAHYESVAMIHQNIALPLYNSAITDINDSNAEALFLYALILMLCPAHSLKRPEDVALENAIRCIQLCRGAYSVYGATVRYVGKGALSPMCVGEFEWCDPSEIDCPQNKIDGQSPPKDGETQMQLDLMLGACLTSWQLAPEHVLLYRTLIKRLQTSFIRLRLAETLPGRMAAIYSWAAYLPAEYSQHLYEWRPQALVLLAFYCLGHDAISDMWAIEGWAQETICEISDCLPNEWHEWIAWPVEHLLQSSNESDQDGPSTTTTYKTGTQT